MLVWSWPPTIRSGECDLLEVGSESDELQVGRKAQVRQRQHGVGALAAQVLDLAACRVERIEHGGGVLRIGQRQAEQADFQPAALDDAALCDPRAVRERFQIVAAGEIEIARQPGKSGVGDEPGQRPGPVATRLVELVIAEGDEHPLVDMPRRGGALHQAHDVDHLRAVERAPDERGAEEVAGVQEQQVGSGLLELGAQRPDARHAAAAAAVDPLDLVDVVYAQNRRLRPGRGRHRGSARDEESCEREQPAARRG
jgi:hypothetical protein